MRFRKSSVKQQKEFSEGLSKATKDVLEGIDYECVASGGELVIGLGKSVRSKSCNVLGFFDQESMEICVAGGLPEGEFLSVLLHEFSHFEQFLDKESIWHDENVFVGWQLYGFMPKCSDLPEFIQEWAKKQLLRLEHDAEIRTVSGIQPRFRKIGLTKGKYCKQANFQLYSIVFGESPAWIDLVDELIEAAPSKILPDYRSYLTLPRKMQQILEQ